MVYSRGVQPVVSLEGRCASIEAMMVDRDKLDKCMLPQQAIMRSQALAHLRECPIAPDK